MFPKILQQQKHLWHCPHKNKFKFLIHDGKTRDIMTRTCWPLGDGFCALRGTYRLTDRFLICFIGVLIFVSGFLNLWMTMFSFGGGDTSLQLLSLIPCTNICPASHQGKPSVCNIFFVHHSQCTGPYWKWPLRLNRQEPKTVWQNQISSRKVSNVTELRTRFFQNIFCKRKCHQILCQVPF